MSSQGKYGWDLDTIKIMTALALMNSDLKAANQGRYSQYLKIMLNLQVKWTFSPRRGMALML